VKYLLLFALALSGCAERHELTACKGPYLALIPPPPPPPVADAPKPAPIAAPAPLQPAPKQQQAANQGGPK
jgi:hypothetical protein